jgi:hypothetical protein
LVALNTARTAGRESGCHPLIPTRRSGETKHQTQKLKVHSSRPPVVEFDAEAKAV